MVLRTALLLLCRLLAVALLPFAAAEAQSCQACQYTYNAYEVDVPEGYYCYGIYEIDNIYYCGTYEGSVAYFLGDYCIEE